MSKSDKALAAFTTALREEIKRELLAAQDNSKLQTAQREIKNLRDKLRKVTTQRDTHRARCDELRKHIARYQAELVELRGTVKALPWGISHEQEA